MAPRTGVPAPGWPNVTLNSCPCIFSRWSLHIFKLHGTASILKHQKHVKLLQKHVHMKDMGKSSSRKLRYVIYYTLYRMDAQKTHNNLFFCKNNNIRNLDFSRIYFPPNSRSGAALRPLSGSLAELSYTLLTVNQTLGNIRIYSPLTPDQPPL